MVWGQDRSGSAPGGARDREDTGIVLHGGRSSRPGRGGQGRRSSDEEHLRGQRRAMGAAKNGPDRSSVVGLAVEVGSKKTWCAWLFLDWNVKIPQK